MELAHAHSMVEQAIHVINFESEKPVKDKL